MKGKIIDGKGAGGLHKYVSDKKDAQLIAGSVDEKDFMRIVAQLRSTRPDVTKAAIHIALSCPPGEQLSGEQWQEAVEILREEMKLNNTEFLAYRHADADHDHIHIELCKVTPSGERWDDKHSARRLHKACEKIEEKMGLQKTKTVEEQRAQRAAGQATKPMSDGVMRAFQRTGKVPNRTKDAMNRRIKNERERTDRTALQQTATAKHDNHTTTKQVTRSEPSSGRVDAEIRETNERAIKDSRAGTERAAQANTKNDDSSIYFSSGSTNSNSHANHNFDAIKMEKKMDKNGAQSQQQNNTDGQPPTLGGRLKAELRGEAGQKIWDLYWQNRDKPTFSYNPIKNEINLLAKATPENVSALLDACEEKGFAPLKLHGKPDFLRMAVMQALARGIRLDTSDKFVAELVTAMRVVVVPIIADTAGQITSPSLSQQNPNQEAFSSPKPQQNRNTKRRM